MIANKNKIVDTYWQVLNINLRKQAGVVLGQIPAPFGSFEKAKYLLEGNYAGYIYKPVYWFTTTCRSTEDCLKLLKEKIETYERNNYMIYKIVKGNKKLIYKTKKIERTY